MMSHRFLWIALAGLLVAGLLFGGISAAQRSAWNEGFMMGQLTASSDGGAVNPMLPYAYGYGAGPMGGGSFGGFGWLLGIGLLFVLFAGFSRMARRHAWGMGGHPHHTPPWGHGAPPWTQGEMKAGCRGWQSTPEAAEPAVDPVPPAGSER